MRPPERVVVALDQGSGSSRALAVAADGTVVARAQFPVRTRYPRAGWVEHDALGLARSQERALDQVLDALSKRTEVAALGIASQRSTFVLWDSRTGRPLTQAPSWQDGRAFELAARLQDRQAWTHERTGLYLTPYYSAPKIRWFLDNVPSTREIAQAGALRAAPVASYLLWRLSEGAAFLADPTLAQRTLLFDLRSLAWSHELLGLFGVPAGCLPAIAPSIGDLGLVRRKGRVIPVRAMIGDQQAAAAALGGGEPGAGVLNYGTGAFFLLHTGATQHRVPGLLTSAAWQRTGRPCEFFLEGTVHAAGASVHWLQERLGLLRSVRELDLACRRSRERVFALPAIGGLGAPRWDYKTFTAFFGLTSQTRREDLVRGVVEGIAFLLGDIVAGCRAAGLGIDSLRASGGLSRSAALLQFQSDLLQLPIQALDESEATALGAAMMAGEAAGLVVRPRLSAGRTFAPRLPAEEAQRLAQAWRVFVESQQKLSLQLRDLKVLP
ncbi:MAG: glycerol kinase [Elusimicrobia bacterium]|nr:glycerol kinase [Elusimicrobiota bacterium]